MSRFLPIASMVLIAACATDAPALNDPAAPQLNITSGFWVTTLQVRPADNSASSIFGPLQVAFGTRYPPSPCNSELSTIQGGTTLAFCGVLQNPAGESLQSGSVTLRASPDAEPVQIRFALDFPPSPCLTVLVGGTLPVSSEVFQSSDHPTVAANFFTSTGAELVGDYAALSDTPTTVQGVDGSTLASPVCTVNVPTDVIGEE